MFLPLAPSNLRALRAALFYFILPWRPIATGVATTPLPRPNRLYSRWADDYATTTRRAVPEGRGGSMA
jgi:hypothetical protein